MGAKYSDFTRLLDTAMRQSDNLNKALEGFAFLNSAYPESQLLTTPSVQLYTLYKERYFPNPSWAEGYANKLWEAFSRNPITREFDALYATESVRNFEAPQLSDSENMQLRAYISKKYFTDLSGPQADALLAAHAKYIQDNPVKEGSVLYYLPGAVWQSTKELALNPTGALLDTIDAANRLFPNLMSGLKQWAIIGGVVLAAVYFGPMILKKVAASRGRSS